MGLYNEAINQNIDNLQVNGRLGNGSGGTGGTGFKSEIVYTNSGTNRDNIELTKPYTDFDYLDITVIKYDDSGYYDFMHTFIDCSQQTDIINNILFAGRENTNIETIWSSGNNFMRYKFTDATHITYPTAGGSSTIYQIKGIKL